MSYRSFKRVLGETHLDRKCRFLFGLCLLVLISASFWFYGSVSEKLVVQQNPVKGDLLVDTALILKHWEIWDTYHGSSATIGKPSKDDRDRAEVVKDLGSGIQSADYQFKFIRPPNLEASENSPPSPTGGRGGEPAARSDLEGAVAPADAFEQELVERFMRMPAPQPSDPPEQAKLYQEGRFTPRGDKYEFYRPVYAQKSCIGCHRVVATGPTNLAEGDLVAVAKVVISNEATRQDLILNQAFLWTAAIVTFFLAMIVAYLIVRYVIVKPLQHLRDVSDAVSRGNLDKRAEIHTDDEFEELGVAFNRMLGNLLTAQEELRRLNNNLDVKVDELAQANMQLFELNRLKSDFLATMSHELRTPLNSIIGFSDVLGSIKSLDDKQRRYVLNIQKSGKMLLDMINDILDLAKIESGKMEVRPTRFPIEHVIAAQCDMARPLSERKNIDLEADIELGLPELYQDQGKLQQMLNNLLSNAIKFTPEGGRIVVSARRGRGDELRLTVADTGVGIAEEDQTSIFEKFRQGNTVMPSGDAMTREYSGTGLGLSIVKELCKLLGGDISLDSELGKGSVFTVRLPWRLPEPVFPSALVEPLEDLTKPRREEFGLPHGRASAAPAVD